MDYSMKDFMNQTFIEVSSSDFPVKIMRSCFYQENLNPDKSVVEFDIFPSDIVCTFENCNMTNVKKHAGMTYINCQTDTICVQQDMEDWHTDQLGEPLEPNDKVRFERLGISINPRHVIKSEVPVTKEVKRQLGGFE